MIRGAIFQRTILLIVAGLATGCYESEFPLDPAPQVQTDSRLMGAWRCVTPDANDEASTLTVDGSQGRTYAVTLQESGKPPDRYEGYTSSLKAMTLVNLRNIAATPKRWVFIHYAFLQPNILLIQVVHERLLKGVAKSPAAVRKTIERERLNPELYEDSIVCVRMHR
jgi:hypothetical protein